MVLLCIEKQNPKRELRKRKKTQQIAKKKKERDTRTFFASFLTENIGRPKREKVKMATLTD